MSSAPWLSAARRVAASRSVVLAYHGVAPRDTVQDPGFLRVSPERFRWQVETLLGAGFEFVTVAEFARRVAGGPPPPGLVALSFDDGMDDNHAVLLPLLREYAIPATVYVTTGLIGRPNPFMPEHSGARMMTEEELADLVAAGVELGAHTVSHPDLSALDEAACLREMTESRRHLEERLGISVRTFAYPFCFYGPAAVSAARRAGFEAAVTCQARGSWAPLEMKRSMISGKDGPASFVAKLAELYDPVFHSSAGRLARTATRRARAEVRSLMERRGAA